jgi:hypothetical protein
MKKLSASYIHLQHGDIDETGISSAMDAVPRFPLSIMPWSYGGQAPSAFFSVAHSNHFVIVKYYIRNDIPEVRHYTTNSAVYEDSCVEFFIQFPGDQLYYNFEFNCLGVCLASVGSRKEDRTFFMESEVDKIGRFITLKRNQNNRADWEMIVTLPLSVFNHHSFTHLSSLSCKANFYKAGQLFGQPHYLAWAPIETETPDFHLPANFGEIIFLPAGQPVLQE